MEIDGRECPNCGSDLLETLRKVEGMKHEYSPHLESGHLIWMEHEPSPLDDIDELICDECDCLIEADDDMILELLQKAEAERQ